MESHVTQGFLDYVRAFGPFLATLVAVGVGMMQYYLQRERVKQDLFDRRLHVYESTLAYLITILQKDGKIELSDHQHFRSDTDAGEFIFGSDVFDFITDVRKTGLELRSLQTQLNHCEVTASGRVTGSDQSDLDRRYNKALAKIPVLQKKRSEIEMKLANALENGTKQAFRPYLQLHHDQSWLRRLIARIDRWVEIDQPAALASRSKAG